MVLSIPIPTFIFPCPRKNSCVGREKNIPGQRRKFKREFGRIGSVVEKDYDLALLVKKRDRKRVCHVVMTHPFCLYFVIF